MYCYLRGLMNATDTQATVVNLWRGSCKGRRRDLRSVEYEGDPYFYLFGCDEEWSNITDTWHQTVDEAIAQAEFEYEGAAATMERHA